MEEREYTYSGKYDTHKQKSQMTDEIFTILKNEDKEYQIFEHTSCALSCLFSTADYNMHYTKNNCTRICKNYDLCHNVKYEISNDLENKLKKIGINSKWKIENGILIIDGSLNDEQKSYIKHILHLQVKSSMRENTYSEKIMEGIE